MSLYQAPPKTLSIGGIEYPIETDFRLWVEFQSILAEPSEDGEKARKLLAIMERFGLPPSKETLSAMIDFYTAASTEHTGTGSRKAAIFDFEKDSEFIYAAFRSAYRIDLTEEKIHWWRFKALFKALPDDCEFCKIMRYRAIDLKDVPKGQRKFYREMKARYALSGNATGYRTEQDMRDYIKSRYEEAQARLAQKQGGEDVGK